MSVKTVVLVHGIFRQSLVFRKLAGRLQAQGYTVYAPDLFHHWGALSLAEVARQLANFIDTNLPPDASFDLVGLSMGGLVSRYYLQRLGGCDRVQHFIAIASPHFGTWLAYGFPRPTSLEMRPGSRFLQDLNRDLHELPVNLTTIWTPWDFIIVPARSCCLPIGRCIRVNVIPHARMAWSDRSIDAILETLAQKQASPSSSTLPPSSSP